MIPVLYSIIRKEVYPDLPRQAHIGVDPGDADDPVVSAGYAATNDVRQTCPWRFLTAAAPRRVHYWMPIAPRITLNWPTLSIPMPRCKP